MQLLRFVPALTIAALAGCSSESATGSSIPESIPPTPGWLTVQLTTPNSDDGAVQLAVTGPAADSVIIVNYDGFAARAADVVNIVVDGQITSGEIARIHVPDTGLANQYQASVSAAAIRDTYQLQSTILGYRATVVR